MGGRSVEQLLPVSSDFMILNDGLCIEKNEKKKKFPIFSFWDMVDFKCEKSGIFFLPFTCIW